MDLVRNNFILEWELFGNFHLIFTANIVLVISCSPIIKVDHNLSFIGIICHSDHSTDWCILPSLNMANFAIENPFLFFICLTLGCNLSILNVGVG